MRDLDKRVLLSNDFLVVYGDLIANIDISPALTAHKARREKDKNAIMTMILRSESVSGPPANKRNNQAMSYQDLFVIDPDKERCLHYESLSPFTAGARLHLDPDLLSSRQSLELRTDLLDTGIDICTPDVLALWSDNFDFQHPRRGFLYSVLKDYELNGKTIHVHIESEKYAMRASGLGRYARLTQDVVGRWAFPFAPDSNLGPDQGYRMRKVGIYQEDGLVLARSCRIGRGTVVGRGTSVGEASVVENSVIGRDCIIGRNVRIEDAFIWNKANIGDDSVVKEAVVADEAAVGKKCVVEPGALISFGVRIADGTAIQGHSRITRVKRKRDGEEEVEQGESDPHLVGQGGDGFEYVDENEEEEDIFDRLVVPSGLVYSRASLALSAESVSTLHDDELSDEPHARRDRFASGSFTSIGSDDSTSGQTAQQARDFHHEAYTSILDSLNREDDGANIQLELSALKLSANASEHQVRRAVVTAMVRFISQRIGRGLSVQAAVEKLLPRFKILLERTMFDHSAEDKTDQVDFMLLLQQECLHQEKGEDILARLSLRLTVDDVIQAEGLEQWWEDEKSTEGDMARIRGKTKQVVDAVVGDSDEESGEEDEDEDDEDDDESTS